MIDLVAAEASTVISKVFPRLCQYLRNEDLSTDPEKRTALSSELQKVKTNNAQSATELRDVKMIKSVVIEKEPVFSARPCVCVCVCVCVCPYV